MANEFACARCHDTGIAHAVWCGVDDCNCGWGGECPDCVPWVSDADRAAGPMVDWDRNAPVEADPPRVEDVPA